MLYASNTVQGITLSRTQVKCMPHIAIIADDLTGANDTGVQFAKYGLRTHVVIAAAGNNALPDEADVIVIDTDSRGLDSLAAYERVLWAAKLIKNSNIPIIYKKVDSTLRGNLGSEIDAVLDVFGFDCAIVAPAFPRIGRITVGGYHLLNQIPLQATEVAQDPKSPVTDSRLSAVLKTQSRYQVAHIELADILAGEAVIRRLLEKCVADGVKLISFDATDEIHLKAITLAVYNSGKHVLWVGSAGMAECLPTLYQLAADHSCQTPKSKGLPVLVVAGSVSSVTASQIDAFLARPNTALVTVKGENLIEQPTVEVSRCVEAARQHIQNHKNVALVSSNGRESVELVRARGGQFGLDSMAVSDLIAEKLGEITQQLVDDGVEGVFITGGDTAVRVCVALGASSMEVCSEMAPGIPFCRLSSGKYVGLKVVTKAGAFGDEQAINKAVATIQNK
ncbi:MAG: type effector Hrp-dependent outer protein [Anaerosporomusa subterranea]|nr:type effector Hrp-dependent outer protein [Anaerosporomusa subterranea]